MQYGRICYWCCKMKGDKKENTAILDKYLAILITKYLEQPSLYINTLHDVCDNANCSDNKSLILLSKLRDCYLCRYDLQKLDSQYILNKAHSEHKANKSTSTNTKNTPFTTSRGLLIDALSKPHNENNKNLKNLADSFQLYPTLNLEPSPFPKSAIKQKNKEMQERASSDFILKNLITPPRPTPSRKKKMSHRKTSRSHSLKKQKRKKIIMDIDDDDDDDKEQEIMDEDETNYMMECCDIIVSYINYLVDILSTEIYDPSHFIRIIVFSLPMLSHKYSPNAITVNNILLITHKWYKIKFCKNKKKTQIMQFSKKHEIKLIQQILAHLQSKVLATTYSNKNHAQIWKMKEEKHKNSKLIQMNNHNMMEQDEHDHDDNDNEQIIQQQEEEEEHHDDMIDID